MKIDIVDAWYKGAPWLRLFRPLSAVYGLVANQRKATLQSSQLAFPLPIIVVGNITVGGTGKTPVVLALAEECIRRGYSPVIISRGYGGQAEAEDYPIAVGSNGDAALVGDEPAMMAARNLCPVVVDPDRQQAALYAIQNFECDVIISDDGLQHYALVRDFEIVIVDGQRGLGNKQLLPEGPLREPVSRLDEADFVMVNGECVDDGLSHYEIFDVVPEAFVQVTSQQRVSVFEWDYNAADKSLAAIGNPERFKAALAALELSCEMTVLPDHHPITRADLPEAPRVVMTEKDAIKCRQFEDDRLWYLLIKAELPQSLIEQLNPLLPVKSN